MSQDLCCSFNKAKRRYVRLVFVEQRKAASSNLTSASCLNATTIPFLDLLQSSIKNSRPRSYVIHPVNLEDAFILMISITKHYTYWSGSLATPEDNYRLVQSPKSLTGGRGRGSGPANARWSGSCSERLPAASSRTKFGRSSGRRAVRASSSVREDPVPRRAAFPTSCTPEKTHF